MRPPYILTPYGSACLAPDSGAGAGGQAGARQSGKSDLELSRAKTAERVRRMREMRKQAGLVRVEVYVPEGDVARIRSIAGEMAEEALSRLKDADEGEAGNG